ncbi:MAG: hypothetical protein WCK98_00910 [bacterium]
MFVKFITATALFLTLSSYLVNLSAGPVFSQPGISKHSNWKELPSNWKELNSVQKAQWMVTQQVIKTRYWIVYYNKDGDLQLDGYSSLIDISLNKSVLTRQGLRIVSDGQNW